MKKKARQDKLDLEAERHEIISSQPTHKSRVAFKDLKMVIADTLSVTMQFGNNNARLGAEELAHWIAYDLIYNDGGFKIREQTYDLPRHPDC